MPIINEWPNFKILAVPLLYLAIRINVGGISNYGYHMNQLLFPVMMRGQSYGLTNFISRPFASLATILVEYTSHPLYLVLPLVLLSYFCVQLLHEIDYENGWAVVPGTSK